MDARGLPLGKAELRREALLRRSRATTTLREAAGVALLRAVRELGPARPAAYVSLADEPSTAGLLAELGRARVPVLLPVLLADGDLDWALHDGPLAPGLRGTLQPTGALLGRDAIARCDLVVAPALGVDARGTRLGRGGGAYDRALARTSGYVLAALHDGELHAVLPREPHDRAVDGAVLPAQGHVSFGARTHGGGP